MSELHRSEEGGRVLARAHRELLDRWPVPRKELRIPTRQGETFVVASGAERSPPLILLHGGGTSSAMWSSPVARWAGRFRVYAVDLIGEPGFSAPSRPPLGSDAYATWLDEVMQALSVQRAALVGLSMGGWMALDWATRRPERIERLALLSPLGLGRQRMSFLLRMLPLLALGDWGRRRLLRVAVGPAQLPPDLMEFMFLASKHFRPRMEQFPPFPEAALRKLTMPVLALLGAKDVILDAAESRTRLQRCVPHATVHVFPDMGHGLEDPSAEVLGFLTGGGAGSA
jgi:pimeloyl-ACP methyl ester carboxylesterase